MKANLRGADLSNLSIANVDLRYACFEEVNLNHSNTTRKCRCDKAHVLGIQNLDGTIADVTEVVSNYTDSFIYRVGETVEEPDYCEGRWDAYAKGIYFFINRQEAVDWCISN